MSDTFTNLPDHATATWNFWRKAALNNCGVGILDDDSGYNGTAVYTRDEAIKGLQQCTVKRTIPSIPLTSLEGHTIPNLLREAFGKYEMKWADWKNGVKLRFNITVLDDDSGLGEGVSINTEEAIAALERCTLQWTIPKTSPPPSKSEEVQRRSTPLEELKRLRAFKDYVHKRLDEAGIPVDPPSPHRDKGCRIGGRLDIALALRSPEPPKTPIPVYIPIKPQYEFCVMKGITGPIDAHHIKKDGEQGWQVVSVQWHHDGSIGAVFMQRLIRS